jgi:translation initiation factor 2 beta subunit (eIF-2beta)/eIF-5
MLKNVLIDQNCKGLEQDEYQELLQEYDSKFVACKDIKQTSFDENCASFCMGRV